jgi:hypothetical protein
MIHKFSDAATKEMKSGDSTAAFHPENPGFLQSVHFSPPAYRFALCLYPDSEHKDIPWKKFCT